MPYFFLVPAYLLFLLVAGVGTAVCYFKYREKAKYGVGLAVGSLVGFLGANALVALLAVLTAIAMDHTGQFPKWVQNGVGILVFLIAFVGPFPASLFGVLVGSALGVFVVYRKNVARTS